MKLSKSHWVSQQILMSFKCRHCQLIWIFQFILFDCDSSSHISSRNIGVEAFSQIFSSTPISERKVIVNKSQNWEWLNNLESVSFDKRYLMCFFFQIKIHKDWLQMWMSMKSSIVFLSNESDFLKQLKGFFESSSYLSCKIKPRMKRG